MYKIRLDVDGIEKNIKWLNKADKIITSDKFKEFMGKKCLAELDEIMERKLKTLNLSMNSDVLPSKVEEYRKNNKYKLTKDGVLIYNDTTLEQSELYWLSSKAKERYPKGISVAYLIEYGTGLQGTSADGWEVNVPSPSKRKNGTWAFKRDGVIYPNESGSSPKLIYLDLKNQVENKLEIWLDEFLQKEM